MPDSDTSLESLRKLAEDIDSGKVSGDEPTETPEKTESKEPKPEAEPKEDDKKPEAEAKADESGDGKPKEEQADSSLNKPDVSKEEKAKTQKASNEERKGKTWQEINAEKEALKAEKARIEAERQEIARLREEAQKAKLEDAPLRDENNLTAEDYRKFAEKAAKEGNEDDAKAAKALADQLDKRSADLKAQRAQEQYVAKFNATCNELVKDNPELNDTNSDLYKETAALYNNPEMAAVFRAKPEYIRFAVQAAKLNIKARTFEKTESEFKKLQSEYDKLSKKLAIGSGQPTPSTEASKAKPASNEDALKDLRKLAVEHDRASGFVV